MNFNKKNSLIRSIAVIVNVFFYLHLLVFVFLLVFNHFYPFDVQNRFTIRGWVQVNPEHWRPEPVESIGNFDDQTMLFMKKAFIRFDYTSLPEALTWNNVRFFFMDNFVKVLWLLITFQMRNIFRSLAKEHVFKSQSLNRIRIIALLFLLIPFAKYLSNLWFLPIVMSEVKVEGHFIRMIEGFDISMLGFAILIVGLGEVFKYGIQLQKQSDLTI